MEWLHCDGRRREVSIWGDWLARVPGIRDKFVKTINYDPFFYNETASVGVLANAASQSGLLALSEYSATKRGNGRGRPHRQGRCDLWVANPNADISWSFEFKQLFCRPNVQETTIDAALRRACEDARAVHPLEADLCFGGVFVSAYITGSLSERAVEGITAVANNSTFACRIDGGQRPVYLILQEQ